MSTLTLIYFGRLRLGHTIKGNYETSDCWSRDMLNFYILRKSLVLVSPPHFLQDISGYISCYILLTDQIYCLTAFSSWEIWQYVLCNGLFLICVVINFEIYLSFLIKSFSYMIKKSEQKFKYLKEKSYYGEIKSIFYHF